MGMPDGSGGIPGRRRRSRKRGQGELEARVLSVLRTAPEPVNAGWVQRQLGEDLAYTTVVTILSRLHEKEIVHRTRAGRAYLWSPAADQAGIAALRMRKLLDGESDRDAVLASFVSSLSAQDEQLMRTLLREADGDPEDPEDSVRGDGVPAGPTAAAGPGAERPHGGNRRADPGSSGGTEYAGDTDCRSGG